MAGTSYIFGDRQGNYILFPTNISMSKVKGSKAAPAPVPAKAASVPAKGGAFDAKAWASSSVSEEEVAGIKQAFDLFDTDQGGSIDIKGTSIIMQNSKLP